MEGYGKILSDVGQGAVTCANVLTSSLYGIESPTILSGIPYEPSDFPATEESPVFLLGCKYSCLHEIDDLRNHFRSIVWFTYRSGFTPIGGDGPTSDRGWGCMLRCGQMILCHALILNHLGPEWRWTPTSSNTSSSSSGAPDIETTLPSTIAVSSIPTCDLPSPTPVVTPVNDSLDPLYKQVVRMFQDKKNSLYSIHQIAQMGESEGKPVGTWFGPNTIAQSLKRLSTYDHQNRIQIHVALDNLVVVNDIKPDKNAPWKPTVLFVPLRLGLTDINPIYYKALKSSFHLPQTLGIIGGRPSHALYFVGYVKDELFYLDPHTTQPVVDLDNEPVPESTTSPGHESPSSGFNDKSYHCSTAQRMPICNLDPSISLCFFCKTESDFDDWCKRANSIFVKEERQPLFEITMNKPSFLVNSVSTAHGSEEPFDDYDLPPESRHQEGPVPNAPVHIGHEASPNSISAPSSSKPMDEDEEEFEFL